MILTRQEARTVIGLITDQALKDMASHPMDAEMWGARGRDMLDGLMTILSFAQPDGADVPETLAAAMEAQEVISQAQGHAIIRPLRSASSAAAGILR